MNNNIYIQLKAAFLIIVFSLNTIIGFTCAVGINMGFNPSHHHDEKVSEGKMDVDLDKIKDEHHSEVSTYHYEASNHKQNNGEDDCCNDKVLKITQLDKAVPQSLSVTNPVFFTIFISCFRNINPLFTSRIASIRYFVRSHHPPIPDIRIAIQSFQI